MVVMLDVIWSCGVAVYVELQLELFTIPSVWMSLVASSAALIRWPPWWPMLDFRDMLSHPNNDGVLVSTLDVSGSLTLPNVPVMLCR